MMSSKGFTLIELLVSVSIFAVLATVVLSIFFITLRASKKADVLSNLKQNGNVVIAQVSKRIRYAKNLNLPASCKPPVTTSSITVTSLLDDGVTKFSCETGSPATIASNGATLLDPGRVTVSSCSFVCSQANFNDPPTIDLYFDLTTNNSSGLVENTGKIHFQTSIMMRNFSR